MLNQIKNIISGKTEEEIARDKRLDNLEREFWALPTLIEYKAIALKKQEINK